MPAKNHWMMAMTFVVSIGGILYGYDIGVISGALFFIPESIPLTDLQLGIIVGAVLGGSLLGTLCAGHIADLFGRRSLILLASWTFLLGIALIVMCNDFFTLLIARIFLGIGVGIVSVGVPLYVTEMVPAKDRGKFVALFQLLLTFGILLAYFMDLLFIPSHNWRAMFAVVALPALILFLGMLFLPESPRWLILNGRKESAEVVLKKLKDKSNIQREIQLILDSHIDSSAGRWKDLFSPMFLGITLTALGIAICNQLTGINSFLQYAPLLLKNSGTASEWSSMLGSLSIGLVNFLSTGFSLFLIDRLGRRPLLLVGTAGIVVAECFLAIVQSLPLSNPVMGALSLIGLLVFIICFAIGPGVVVWLAISELFPTSLRGKGMAACLFLNSLASTLLATFFLPLAHLLGYTNIYWLFALFTLIYFILAYLYLPETKAKRLEEIQNPSQKLKSLLSQ